MWKADPGFHFTGFNDFHSGSNGAGQFPSKQAMSDQDQAQDLGDQNHKKGDAIMVLGSNFLL